MHSRITEYERGSSGPSATDDGMLAGKTLKELREEYRYWLFDDYLPFHDEFCVDREYGGCAAIMEPCGLLQMPAAGWAQGHIHLQHTSSSRAQSTRWRCRWRCR